MFSRQFIEKLMSILSKNHDHVALLSPLKRAVSSQKSQHGEVGHFTYIYCFGGLDCLHTCPQSPHISLPNPAGPQSSCLLCKPVTFICLLLSTSNSGILLRLQGRPYSLKASPKDLNKRPLRGTKEVAGGPFPGSHGAELHLLGRSSAVAGSGELLSTTSWFLGVLGAQLTSQPESEPQFPG